MYKWNGTCGVHTKRSLVSYDVFAYQWSENKELMDVVVLWRSWPSYLVVSVLLHFVVDVDLMWELSL